MKKIFCAFLPLLLSVLPLSVVAEGTADALKNLEAAIKKEIESRPIPNDPVAPGYRDRPDGGRAVFTQIEIAIANGETDHVEQQLTQLPTYFTSDEVHQQILKLAAVLKSEREAKRNAYAAEINAAFKQASDTLQSAKSPQDLDEALKNLSEFRNKRGSDRLSDAARSALDKVEPTLIFLKQWQDYLAAQKSGSVERARQALSALTNSGNSDLIPRSQLLAEWQKYPTEQEAKAEAPRAEQIDEIVAKVKGLDGVNGAIKELRKIQSRSRPHVGSDPITATLNALVSIERTCREFQAGLPTRLEGPSMQSPDLTSPAVTPLRVQLLLLVLPRYLNVPADLGPKPRESVQAYLQRVIDEARARADGALMTRARDAQRFFGSGIYQFSTDSQGITLMTAAKNQETAGQYVLAVVSYQNALKNGGDAVPAKLIGDKLAALKGAHPQEYDEGMKIFMSPPRFDYPPPFARAGPFAGPTETPPGVLPIPPAAASASPTATPKPAASATPSTAPH